MLLNLKPFFFFLLSCITASIYSFAFGVTDSWLLITCCLIILIAGLPHGAFDIYILEDLFKGKIFFWSLVAYVGLIFLTILFWWLTPLVFLITFLAYSAIHFGDSDWPLYSFTFKVAWGSAIITLPCLFSANQVTSLFAIILETQQMPTIASTFGYIAIITTIFCSIKNTTAFILLSFYAILCKFGGALVAFTCYFAFLHGPRHLGRWREKLPNRSNIQVYLITISILIGIILLVLFTSGENSFNEEMTFIAVDQIMIRYTFVALAALTVPHMVSLFVADHLKFKH